MVPHIDHLPLEVLTHIFSYVRHSDLANLVRVSKSFNRIVTPILWTHIELHVPGWHENYQYEDASSIAERNLNDRSRRYIDFPPDEPYCRHLSMYPWNDMKIGSARFVQSMEVSGFDKVSLLSSLEQGRSDIPYKHLKSLCLEIDIHECSDTYSYWSAYLKRDETINLNAWRIFSAFQNLESLELVVKWPYDPKEWDIQVQRFSEHEASLPKLTRLRKLCLRGYVPSNFALWILSCPEQLRTLELSILDRPISSHLCDRPINPAPIRKRDQYPLEDIEDDGGEIPWVTEASDSGSDSESEEDLEGDAVGPRALSIFQDSDIPDRLKNLSTLVLTRPAQSLLRDPESGYDGWQDPICCSVHSDKAILREWVRLIQATRGTIQHLILDQRPFCEETEPESTGNNEFLELYPYGPGFQRFKEIVLPVLLEDAEWPMLKSLRFYGFDLPETRQTKSHPRVYRLWPSQDARAENSFLPEIKQHFEPLGVDVDSYLGRRMVFRDDEGTVESGDGLGGDRDDSDECWRGASCPDYQRRVSS